jgi:hypothetical protein
MNWLGSSEHKLGVDKWNICLVQAAASVGSSQAPTAAVEDSAPVSTHPESTYKSGKAVQTNRDHFYLTVYSTNAAS